MEFRNFIQKAKTVKDGEEIWLSDKTFNNLAREAEEIRISEQGYLELRNDKLRIQISMRNQLFSGDLLYFAEVMNASEHANYTGIKESCYFTHPEKAKKAIIL